MRGLNIIWMFVGGIAAAVAFTVLLAPDAPPGRIGNAVGAGGSNGAEAAPRARPTPDPSTLGGGTAGALRAPRAGESRARTGASRGGPAGPAAAPARAPASGGDRADVVRELRAMSHGYRNRVLLHVIRQRGHYCEGIVDARPGGGDVVSWRVGCAGAYAYLVGIDSSGELVVEALHYTDSTAIRGPELRGPGPGAGPRFVPVPEQR